MPVILPTAKNPWGATRDPQRADLWLVDLAPAINQMIQTMLANNVAPSWLNELAVDTLVYSARSVTLPIRQINVAQVKLDNATGNFPGYNQPTGTVAITFMHDADSDLTSSQVWLALEIWRAFSRAGQGFSTTTQGQSQLNLSLAQASRPMGAGLGLVPDYVHDISVTLLRGADLSTVSNATTDPTYRLAVGARYILKQAWLADLQLGDLSYEAGNRTLEIRAAFSINDYYLATSSVQIGAAVAVN